MTRRVVRLPTDGRPLLDILSFGRTAPSGRFTPAQIEQIRRTVTRAPEVMVKVTGGGMKVGAAAAHLAYISRKGELSIETDEGERIASRDAQKALLNEWHLELTTGQYRAPRDGRRSARHTKLVHNVVLSMPSPTPPEKVLAAARKFAREKFALQHRYALVLHTDQQHPHVHMVVKAESEEGRRLYIDKATLRSWREDFAQLMREQGIAANATSQFVLGKNKGKTLDGILRAQRRHASTAVRERVAHIAEQLKRDGAIHDPAQVRLNETRKELRVRWQRIAETLDQQGEVALAGDVRYFTRHLPPVLTDRQALADALARCVRSKPLEPTVQKTRNVERTR